MQGATRSDSLNSTQGIYFSLPATYRERERQGREWKLLPYAVCIRVTLGQAPGRAERLLPLCLWSVALRGKGVSKCGHVQFLGVPNLQERNPAVAPLPLPYMLVFSTLLRLKYTAPCCPTQSVFPMRRKFPFFPKSHAVHSSPQACKFRTAYRSPSPVGGSDHWLFFTC